MQREITIVNRGRGPQLSTSRITVQDILPYFQLNYSCDQIREVMPSLSVGEIQVVERYFNEHREELLEADRRIRARNAARKNPPEVDEILRRGREQIRARLAAIEKRNAHGLNGALGVFGLDSRAACFARVRRLMDTERPIRIGLDRWSLCGLILLAAIALPRIHAAQEVNQPNRHQEANSAPTETGADANDNPPQSGNQNPDGSMVLAKDAGKFELNVIGRDGKPIPEATVELRIDPSPTAEQVLQGKFVRKGDYGALVTADSEGRVVVKWPQSSGKSLVVRILASGYQPYWASWSSANESAPVPAKSTFKLAAAPTAEGLAMRKDFLFREGGAIFFVAASNAVRKDIGIDGAAANTVQSIAEQYCEAVSAGRTGLEKAFQLADLSPEEMVKRSREYFEKEEAETKSINEKFNEQLKAALTARQLERLQQIARQVYGSVAWQHDTELAKALDLREDQIKKVATINREYAPKEFELLRSGAVFAQYQELVKERDSKAKELLTPEQQMKLATLEGKPFDLALLTSQIPPQQFGWFGGSIVVFTVANGTVQKDLGLNEDAATRVKQLQANFRAAWFVTGRGFRGRRVRVSQDEARYFEDVDLPPWDFGEWKAVTAKFLPQLKEALTADQYTRLQQIDWQTKGTAAYWDPEVIQALAITKEQQNKIASVTNEYVAKRQELFAQGGGDIDLRHKKMSELIKEHDAKINASLTKAQLDTFAMLKGKEFDVDQLRIADLVPRPARGPGRTGPGGAGPGRAEAGQLIFIGNGGMFSAVKNEAVQKELGLSRDAAMKALAIRDQFNKTWRDAGGGFRIRLVQLANGGMLNFQEAAMPPWGILPFPGQTEEARTQEIAKMMELWKATNAKFQAQLKEALEADQYTRLQQINWQAMGTAAYYADAEVIEALAITKEQQATITSIANEYVAKRQELFKPGGEGDGSELREKMTELTKEQDVKINATLSKDQLDKFAMMKGKEFDVDQLRDAEPPRFPGRGSGRGGEDGRPK